MNERASAQPTCIRFSEDLASKDPVPGGGGASAYVGALAAALGQMVGNLTIGKKRYAAVEEEIKTVLEELDGLRIELIGLVDEDAAGFLPLAQAYGLPRKTDEEQQHRDRVMETALLGACSVPATIMEKCGQVIDRLDVLAGKGSRMVLSDAGAGAALARAALDAASLNVYINAKSMNDRAAADRITGTADRLRAAFDPKADRIFAAVSCRNTVGGTDCERHPEGRRCDQGAERANEGTCGSAEGTGERTDSGSAARG